MARTPSTMVPLGTPMPDFSLPTPEGEVFEPAAFQHHPVLVVAFLSNHCPYVKHVQPVLAKLSHALAARGVAFVGIHSNDVDRYPDDAPHLVASESRRVGFAFPQLIDEQQEAARAFHAACTPDFFVYDRERRLAYRGQLDDARPGSPEPVTGKDLLAAVEALLEGRAPTGEQWPSMGCNIKWKAGNEPG